MTALVDLTDTAAPKVSVPGVLRRQRRNGLYVAMMGVSSLIGFGKGLVYAKVLGSTDFGLYGIALIVLMFGTPLASWGILSALNQELPIAMGREESDVDARTGRALGAVVTTGVATTALYLAAVAAARPGSTDTTVALLLAGPLVIGSTVGEFFLLVLRVQRRPLPLAASFLMRSLLAVTLGAAAGALFGYVGVMIAEFAALVLSVAVAWWHWLPGLRPHRPRRIEVRRLLRAGVPIAVANLLIIGTFAIDRVFVAAALPDEFGQYAFASLVVVAWLAANAMLTQVLPPKLLFEHGAGLPLPDMRTRALRVALAIAGAGAAGYALLHVLTGVAADGFLSEYAPGLHTMRILYLGGLLTMISFPGFMLNAFRPSFTTLAAGLGTLVLLGGGALLSARGGGLDDYAWLFVASQAVVLVAMLTLVEVVVRRPPA